MLERTRLLQCLFVIALALFSPQLTATVDATYCDYQWNHTGCMVGSMNEIYDAISNQCGGQAVPGCTDFCGCAYGVVGGYCSGVTNWECEDDDCPIVYCEWNEDCCNEGCWEGQCEGPTVYE